MPFYRCQKCFKEFNRPYLLERHNKRKNPCDGIKIKYDNDNIVNEENINNKNKNIINDDYIPIKNDKTLNNEDNINILFNLLNEIKKDNELLKEDNKLLKNNYEKTELLLKEYKKENNELNKKVKKLNNDVEKISIISKNGSHNINYNITNNTNNTYNINIVNHGSEKYDNVVDFTRASDYRFDRKNTGILEQIFYQIHLNPKCPEYFNVYVPNTNKNVIMIFIDGEWLSQNKRLVLGKLIDNILYYIEDRLKIMNETEKANVFFNYRDAKREMNRYFNYSGDYYTFTKRKTEIFKELESSLYNNKNMIIDNHKREKIKMYSINNSNTTIF